ncbi:hypothetical protein OFY05_07610 [Pseudocitrobacter faecalis]|nr:hypothetical protein OFY05_07610 [Pseudocitrobacter faecalis]
MLYRLDPATLATTGETHTDYKNFGMASEPDGSVFYTHLNSLMVPYRKWMPKPARFCNG